MSTGDAGAKCLLIHGTRLAQCLGKLGHVPCLLHCSSLLPQTWLMLVYIICGLFFLTCTKIKPWLSLTSSSVFSWFILFFFTCKKKKVPYSSHLRKEPPGFVDVICSLIVILLLDEDCDS